GDHQIGKGIVSRQLRRELAQLFVHLLSRSWPILRDGPAALLRMRSWSVAVISTRSLLILRSVRKDASRRMAACDEVRSKLRLLFAIVIGLNRETVACHQILERRLGGREHRLGIDAEADGGDDERHEDRDFSWRKIAKALQAVLLERPEDDA